MERLEALFKKHDPLKKKGPPEKSPIQWRLLFGGLFRSRVYKWWVTKSLKTRALSVAAPTAVLLTANWWYRMRYKPNQERKNVEREVAVLLKARGIERPLTLSREADDTAQVQS